MRAGGVAVRSESLAGMSWGSPPLFSAGARARLNFGGGRAASKVGERGAAGWLLQLLQGRGGGSGQTFFPVSFRREEPPGGEEEGRSGAGRAAESQSRVLCACVFCDGFPRGGRVARRPCGFVAAFLNPAAEEGGSWLRKLG